MSGLQAQRNPLDRYYIDRRTLLRASAVLGGATLMGSFLSAFGGTGSAGGDRRGFTYAYATDIDTLDPQMTTSTTTQNVYYQMFEGLVQMGRGGKYQGALAESWENVDDRTWKFHLRKNVKFHNGEPFNAAAVKFSYQRMVDPALKSPAASTLSAIDHVDVIDNSTIALVTKRPYAATLSIQCPIVPPKYIGEKGNGRFAAAPVGTGAFKFVEWKKDVHVKMDANLDYWRGEPAISSLTFRPIPEASSRIAALVNGEVDWIAALDVDRVADLKSNKNITIGTRPGQALYGGLNTLTFKPFADKRVRQAMNFAVDANSIVKNIFHGQATRLPSVLFTATPGFDPKMSPYPYDPEKAKALLADAGYSNGFSGDLSVVPGNAQKLGDVSQAVAADLAKVGVTANIQKLDAATGAQLYHAGKFQLYIYTWASSHEAGLYVDTLLKSTTRGYYYKSPQADTLIDIFMTTLDPTKRAEAGKTMNRFFYDDYPWLFLYQEPDIYGYRQNIDWQPNPYTIYFYAYEVKFK